MRCSLAAGCLATILTISGCGHRAVEISPEAQPVGNRWNATLATPAGLAGAIQVTGSGWMGTNSKDPQTTQAHVEILNAAPGGRHPWHVHRGQCGADEGVFGPADAYSELKVGGDGKAQANATLSTPMPAAGQYFINVHASAANMNTIVACGNLAPPAQ
jgi:hypothetical protein